MAANTLLLARGLRQIAQQSVASTSARCFSVSAQAAVARPKPTAAKKKSTVKKKTMSGPRGAGGKRKGGSDSSSSLSRSSEFHKDAPSMANLAQFNSESLVPSTVGETLAWNETALSAFKQFQLPQDLEREVASQPRPRTLVREQTLALDKLDKSKPQKLLLTGSSGCGKSTLLAQSVAFALDEGYAVIYVPRAINLINSSSPYTYSPSQMAYLQPEATRQLLNAAASVNAAHFKNIKTTEAVQLDRAEKVEAGTTLEKLAKMGAADSLNAAARHQVFELVLKTLAEQSDVPVLVAVDDAQALFRTSTYRDPDYKQLDAFELGVPRALLALVHGHFKSSRLTFLGALSTSHTEFPTPAEVLVTLSDSANAVHAYTSLHERHLANAQAAAFEAIDVSSPLTKTEAAALFAQLKAERKYWTAASDELFVAKYIESAGNARRFNKSLVSTLL